MSDKIPPATPAAQKYKLVEEHAQMTKGGPSATTPIITTVTFGDHPGGDISKGA